MFEMVVGLATLALIFLVTSIVAGNRYLALHHENRKLEQMNADLRYSVKFLKGENKRLQDTVYIVQDDQELARMKLQLLQKQERIEALQLKVKRQHQLLNQKWGESKCH